MAYGVEVPSDVLPNDSVQGTSPGGDSVGAIFAAQPAPRPRAPSQPAPAVAPAAQPEESVGAIFDTPRPTVRNPNLAARQRTENVNVEDEQAKESNEVADAVAELSADLSSAESRALKAEEKKDLSLIVSQLGEDEDMGEKYDRTRPAVDDTATGFGVTVPTSIQGAKELLGYMAARARGGLGRNKKEELAAWRSMYGDENAELHGEDVWFRKNAEDKWRKVDSDQFEIFADIFADNSGNIVEGASTAVAEGAAIAGGLVAAPGTAGASVAAGAMAAAGAGGFGAMVRDATIGAVDEIAAQKQRDDDLKLGNEILWGMGLNGAFSVAGAALKPVAKGVTESVGGKLKSIMDSSQMRRIEKLKHVRQWLDDFKVSAGGGRGDLEGAARSAFGVVDQYGDELGNAVKLVEGKAVELGADRRVSMQSMISKMKEVLEDQGATFAKDGSVTLPAENLGRRDLMERLSKRLADIEAEHGPEAAARARDLYERKAAEAEVRAIAPFGSKSGMTTMREIGDDYNILIKANRLADGVPVSEVFNMIRKYQGMSKFSPGDIKRNGAEIAAFRKIQNAGTVDRGNVLKEIFEGTGLPEEKIFKDAYVKFEANIDDITSIRKLFRKKESAAQFAEAVFQKGNPERVETMKRLLGSQSDEWRMLRGEWIGSLIEKHIDQSTGIFDARSMINTLKEYGKDVTGHVFNGREVKQLERWSKQAQRIPFSDMVPTPRFKNEAEELVVSMAWGSTFGTVHKLRAFFNLLGGKNKYVADYLLNDGFMNAASKAGDRRTKNAIMTWASEARQAVNQMRVVKVRKTDPSTGKTVMIPQYVPVAGELAAPFVKDANRTAEDSNLDLK